MKKITVFLCATAILAYTFGVGYADTTPIFSENFDNGLAGWTQLAAAVGNTAIDGSGITGQYAILGTGKAGDSYIYKDFSIAAGYNSITVSFDWYFYYQSNNKNGGSDSLFFSILDNGTTLFKGTIATKSGEFNGGVPGTFSQTFSINKLFHTEELTFKLQEDQGEDENSYAAIDNIRVTADSAPVPIPTTLLLLGSGLAGIVAFRKKSGA